MVFLFNPFLTATKNSYRLMKQLGDYTVAALTAYTQNPASVKAAAISIFNDLLATLQPLSENYGSAYE